MADMKLCFLKRMWGPSWQPLIGKLLTLTNSTVMHCFIDTFGNPLMYKSVHIFKLNMAKKY